MTQSYEVLVDCVLPVLRAFGPEDESERVEACLYDIVVSGLRHFTGDLYLLEKNNKSGSPFTIFVNMILQGVILEYTRLESGATDTWNYVLCGDDNILVKPDDGIDPFEFYPNFGLKMKYVYKETRFEDSEFLSKKFVYLERYKAYVGVVDVEKHLCSLKYEPVSDPGLVLQKVNSLILESAWSDGVERLVQFREELIRLAHNTPFVEQWRIGMAGVESLDLCRLRHLYKPEKFRSFEIINNTAFQTVTSSCTPVNNTSNHATKTK
jgi:hypothetical protein